MSEGKAAAKGDGRNVYQRLVAVMDEVGRVAMAGTAPKEAGGYRYVRHDDVTAAVRPALVKHGVLVVPSVARHERDGNMTVLEVDVAFVNADDPSDRVEVRHVGYGIDRQDKGPGKGLSYAVKYALLKVLSLETGDDPEADSVEHEPASRRPARPASPAGDEGDVASAYARRFWQVAKGSGVSEKTVRAYVARHFPGVASTKEMTLDQLTALTAWARGLGERRARLSDAMVEAGLTVDEVDGHVQRVYGCTLDALTLEEWDHVIAWAGAQEPAAETGPDEEEPPF